MAHKFKLRYLLIPLCLLLFILTVITTLGVVWFDQSLQVPPEQIYSTYIKQPSVEKLLSLSGKNRHFRAGPLLIRFTTHTNVELDHQEEYLVLTSTNCMEHLNQKFGAQLTTIYGDCLYYQEVENGLTKSQRWLVRQSPDDYILAILDS